MQFVSLASQNTMAALIGGFTLHSFHNLSFKHKDGTTVAVLKEDRKEISSVFLRYQALRFMFIDEFSTASIDVVALQLRQVCLSLVLLVFRVLKLLVWDQEGVLAAGCTVVGASAALSV